MAESSLRQVLAELDMRVRGLDRVDEANNSIDRYVQSTKPAATQTEKLRIEQQQAFETAKRLQSRIRKLQKAEGNHERQIKELRLAMVRAKDSAHAYGREIDDLNRSQTTAATKAGGTGPGGLVGSMRGAAGAVAGIAAAAGGAVIALQRITEGFRELIETASEIDVTSRAVGINAEELQQWQFIARRVGIDQGDIKQGFGDLAAAAKDGDEAFRELGVDTRDGSGELRDMNSIMTESLGALGGVENETKRLAIAMRLFGEDAGSSFATMSEADLEGLKERAKELGGGLSNDVVDGAVKAGEATQDFDFAMTSLKGELSKEILPALSTVVGKISEFVGWLSDALENTHLMKAVLIALSPVLVSLFFAMAPLLIVGAVFAATFAGIVLVVEDIIAAFSGGRSVFGDFVEGILEMLGIEQTFQGFLESFGVGWDLAKAKVLTAVASIVGNVARMQETLGIEVFEGLDEAARDLQGRANEAARGARQGAVALQQREQERRTQRASANTVKALGGDVDARQEIQINEATDAEGVRRVLEEANEKQRKKIMDMFPSLAEGEPTVSESEGAPA